MIKLTTPRAVPTAILIAIVVVLAGCTTLSHDVARDGSHAQQLVWPGFWDANSLHPNGTFPNLANLRNVQSGLNKEQIISLIGPPQFGEMFRMREWNYLFNFRQPDDSVTQCEFKVLFDHKMVARSFFWNPAACAWTSPAQTKTVTKTRTLNFSGGSLFAFDLASVDSRPHDKLDQFIKDVKAHQSQLQSIQVRGYTDRFGSNSYNLDLSARRATKAKRYMVAHGIPRDLITTLGMGKSDSLVTCPGPPTEQVKSCLQPNRRVEVTATLAEQVTTQRAVQGAVSGSGTHFDSSGGVPVDDQGRAVVNHPDASSDNQNREDTSS